MLKEIVPGSAENSIVATLEAPFGRGINLRMETEDVDVLYARVKDASAKIICRFLLFAKRNRSAAVGSKLRNWLLYH
jgi:hypothetical protein